MIQSINFRLGDSLPQAVLEKWRQELGVVSKRRPGAPAPLPMSSPVLQQPYASKDAGASIGQPGPESIRAIEFRRRIEEYLDAGHGECWLRQPEIARLVEDTLVLFDPKRYRLLAWCIMPNHVHALVETKEGFPLVDVLHSWKSFTSGEANKLLRRRGEFWQREYLDRYIRNATHYENVVAYIEENPVKARLARFKTDWLWSSARFRARLGAPAPRPANS